MKKLAKTETWHDNVDQKLFITIKHWGIEREDSSFEPLNDGKGVWNYYITIPEIIFPKAFPLLWIEDEKVKYTPASPERIVHDYSKSPIAQLDWHCGVTFYKKHGQTEGHRSVEFGCDYSHLYDSERGFNYTLDEVHSEALQTANQILDYLNNL